MIFLFIQIIILFTSMELVIWNISSEQVSITLCLLRIILTSSFFMRVTIEWERVVREDTLGKVVKTLEDARVDRTQRV